MLKICAELFHRWNNENIRYCHWKSNEHLMEGLDGLTDLDVYVCRDDKDIAEKNLIDFDYIKFVTQKGSRYPFVDEWIGFDYDTGKLVHIHLHYQIITGTKYNKEFVFPVNDLMVSTRVFDDVTRVYIASPNLEIIILYSRIVLKATDKKNIILNNDYKKEIGYLKDRINKQILFENLTKLIGNDAKTFYELIMENSLTTNQWYKVYIIVYRWLNAYKKYAELIVKSKYKYYKGRNIICEVCNRRLGTHLINRKTLPNRGMSICFLGADGSGKSTISIDIKKWLNWKIEADRFYLGSGDHFNSLSKKILSKISIFKLRKGKKVENKAIAQQVEDNELERKVEKNTLRRFLHWGYSILQSSYLSQIAVRSFKEIKKAEKYKRNGAIAIYDRFPQNQFLGIYDGPKIRERCLCDCDSSWVLFFLNKEEKSIENAQNYQPDVIFKLLLPPEESIRRKPDHTIEEVRPKSEITNKLIFKNSHVYDIDATQPYDIEILEIKRIIWKEFLENDSRI